jgi:Flp pilus assembly protein TadG
MWPIRTPHRHSRRGMIAVQAALCLTVVLGIAALVIDLGGLQAERGHAQAVADAGALAAALRLGQNSTDKSGATTYARDIAAANGYTHGVNATITVNIPPTVTTENYFKNSQYVEVIAQFTQNRCFSAIWGSDTLPVGARAVAKSGAPAIWNASILTLNTNAQKGIELSGGSDILVPGSIIDDSTNSSTALRMGTGSYMWSGYDPNTGIASGAIQVVGGWSIGDGLAAVDPDPVHPPHVVPDPLALLPAPPLPAAPSPTPPGWVDVNTIWKSPGGSVTIDPGRYAGIRVDSGTVTMNPGIYYITGTGSSSAQVFLISGTGVTIQTVSPPGDGVLIYNGYKPGGNSTQVGQIQIKSQAVAKLSPMSSGTWQGISIFQDQAATAQITISGGSGTYIKGMLYAASAFLSSTGGSDIVPGSAFIVSSLLISGGGTMILPAPPIPVYIPGSSNAKVGLVE